jgi:hypothetical protein
MEIKPNELRKGIYLDFILPGKTIIVDQFYNEGYGNDEDNWFIDHHEIGHNEPCSNATRPIDDFHPTKLTKDWLTKFGFKDCENQGRNLWYGYTLGENFELSKYHSKYYFGWDVIELNHRHEKGFALKLYYVHQLQNLYFALTGNELTI